MLKKMIPYSLICGCKLSVLFTFVLRGISGSGGRGTRGVRPWPVPGGAIARQGGVPFQWVRGVADKVHLITVLIVSLVYHIITIGHPARIWTVVCRHFFRILQLSPPPLSGIDRIMFLKKENGFILLLVTANMNWTQSLSLFLQDFLLYLRYRISLRQMRLLRTFHINTSNYDGTASDLWNRTRLLKKDDYLAQRMGNSSKNDSKCTTEAVM